MRSKATGRKFISLVQVKEGEEYCVTDIAGGAGAHNRLTSLGILRGQNIKLLQRGDSGPLMVLVKGAKVALGRGISKKIMVEKRAVGSGQ